MHFHLLLLLLLVSALRIGLWFVEYDCIVFLRPEPACAFSALTLLGVRKSIRPVEIE